MGMPETIAWQARTARGVVLSLRRKCASLDKHMAGDEEWPGDSGEMLNKGDLRAIKQRLDRALANLDEIVEKAGP